MVRRARRLRPKATRAARSAASSRLCSAHSSSGPRSPASLRRSCTSPACRGAGALLDVAPVVLVGPRHSPHFLARPLAGGENDAAGARRPARTARAGVVDADHPAPSRRPPAARIAAAAELRRVFSRPSLFRPPHLRGDCRRLDLAADYAAQVRRGAREAHETRAPHRRSRAAPGGSRGCRACARSCSRTFSSTRSTPSAPSPKPTRRSRGG